MDLSVLSVNSILRCLQILVPYYIEDVVNEGCYGDLVRLTGYLLYESLAPLSYFPVDSPPSSYRESSDAVERLYPPSQDAQGGSTPFRFPTICSSELEVRVFTPRSSSGNLSTEDGHLDNGRLEWLGDAVIQLSTTLMLEDLYPQLRNGPAEFIRSRVVSNRNLGAISRRYRLYKRFRQVSGKEVSGPNAKVHGTASIVLRIAAPHRIFPADLLESYIGALYKEMEFHELHSFLVDLLKPSVTAAYLSQTSAPREPCLRGTSPSGTQTFIELEMRSPWMSESVEPSTEAVYEHFLSKCRSLGLSPRFELEEAQITRGSPHVAARIYVGEEFISTGVGATASCARAEASLTGLSKVIAVRVRLTCGMKAPYAVCFILAGRCPQCEHRRTGLD